MAQFAARALTVRYGPAVALDHLDLDIASGEIFVLLGGSGSGKTTLLRCAGGFLLADGGTITLGGQDITRLPAHLRPVNTMFQSYALFPHMDVAANIAFGLRRQKLPKTEIAARVEELLNLVRLPGFGARRIGQLSGGQQQRVALARSIAPRPALLLLDEPLSALDRGLRDETRTDLVALLRRFGTTAILVTHDQEEALATADRIGVLHQGRLAQVGTPAEIYQRPANRYVASFLGSANLLEATAGAGGRLDIPGGVALPADPPRAEGTRLHLALRPERLRLVAHAEGPNHLCGVIESSIYRGMALDVLVRLPGGGALRVTQPLAEGLATIPEPGAAACVAWQPDCCILLDA